jgi:Tol biopolymer transport system component
MSLHYSQARPESTIYNQDIHEREMIMISQNRIQKNWEIATAFRMLILLSLLAFLATPSISLAAFPGTNGKIAFVSTRDGTEQIYTMNADGSGVIQLTFTTTFNSYPEWSADGAKIVFESDRDGNHEIYTMYADGSVQTRLTNNAAIDNVAAWSPDGSQIVFASLRDGNSEIYVMNSNGSGQTRLTFDAGSDTQPAWSPDGTKIAFESDQAGFGQIFVMNTDGSNVTQLTTSYRNGGANWSPDGSKIVFHSDRDCNGCGTYFDIYSMNADGTGQTRLANDPTTATLPAWSPDGTKIAFDSQRDSNYEVYIMNADGSGQTNLTSNSAVDFRVSWGPQLITYNFSGFFQPVDNLPTLNSVNAGRAIPVKFSLGGDQGLNIFEAGYPKSQQIACDSTSNVDGIEVTVTAGSSSLSYDASTDIYTYVWKTEKSWAGTCRQLVLKLNDGTFHRANLKFK